MTFLEGKVLVDPFSVASKVLQFSHQKTFRSALCQIGSNGSPHRKCPYVAILVQSVAFCSSLSSPQSAPSVCAPAARLRAKMTTSSPVTADPIPGELRSSLRYKQPGGGC